MKPRIVVFLVLAAGLAALFVRLGFWQLSRLGERRARNAVLAARLAEPVVPFAQLRDTGSFRRARVDGMADYANEIVYAGRSRNGSPGVYLVTPMRQSTSDTAVLVVRGWVYAPDAATVDSSRWRESRAWFSGYVSPLLPPRQIANRSTARRVRVLSREAVQALLPYPVAARYLVAQDSAGLDAPVRLEMPPLDDGPHLSYAIQWFAFALIAVIGGGIVVFRGAGPKGPGASAA